MRVYPSCSEATQRECERAELARATPPGSKLHSGAAESPEKDGGDDNRGRDRGAERDRERGGKNLVLCPTLRVSLKCGLGREGRFLGCQRHRSSSDIFIYKKIKPSKKLEAWGNMDSRRSSHLDDLRLVSLLLCPFIQSATPNFVS